VCGFGTGAHDRKTEEADIVDPDIPGGGGKQERISEEAGGVVDEARAETSGALGAVLGALTGKVFVGAAVGLAAGILLGVAISRTWR
jgi:hypothetical protein